MSRFIVSSLKRAGLAACIAAVCLLGTPSVLFAQGGRAAGTGSAGGAATAAAGAIGLGANAPGDAGSFNAPGGLGTLGTPGGAPGGVLGPMGAGGIPGIGTPAAPVPMLGGPGTAGALQANPNPLAAFGQAGQAMAQSNLFPRQATGPYWQDYWNWYNNTFLPFYSRGLVNPNAGTMGYRQSLMGFGLGAMGSAGAVPAGGATPAGRAGTAAPAGRAITFGPNAVPGVPATGATTMFPQGPTGPAFRTSQTPFTWF